MTRSSAPLRRRRSHAATAAVLITSALAAADLSAPACVASAFVPDPPFSHAAPYSARIGLGGARRAVAASVPAEDRPTIEGEFATSDEIIRYGERVGVTLSLSTIGPGYRAVARASHDEEQIVGYVEGFLRPGGTILHLDKMEVWKKAVDRARKENPGGFKNGGNVFGIGLLLGYLCLLHGKENGCKVGEFLAIDDEEYQHKRLVRYYRYSGFKVIKYVGEDIRDIPDRLVWGGCGTLMREDVDTLLSKWTKTLFKAKLSSS